MARILFCASHWGGNPNFSFSSFLATPVWGHWGEVPPQRPFAQKKARNPRQEGQRKRTKQNSIKKSWSLFFCLLFIRGEQWRHGCAQKVFLKRPFKLLSDDYEILGSRGQSLGQKIGGWDHFLGFLKNRRKNENLVKKSKIMSKKSKIHQKMTPKKWFLALQRTPRKSIFSPPRGADFSIFRFSSRCGVWTEFTEFRIF